MLKVVNDKMLNVIEICGNKKKNGVVNDVDILVDI